MKRLARLLVVTLGLGALALVVSLVPQKTASGTVAANVNVVNSTSQPVPNRDVDNPARQPFQEMSVVSGELKLLVPSTTANGAMVQELVIEVVSGSCTFANETVLIKTQVNGKAAEYAFPSRGGTLISAQSTRLYADAGSNVTIDAGSGTSVGDFCRVSISGYLVSS
jgi:hypothetical protein